MASPLDLAEQEQLDALKHGWKKYGSYVSAALLLAALSYAAWSGWQYWQRQQALKAAALYDAFERVVQSADVDQSLRVFGDLKERHASSIYTRQAALLLAQQSFNRNQPAVAKDALTWLAGQTGDVAYQTIAKLRLAALLVQDQHMQEALALLQSDFPASFAPLVADRRGDILMLLGKQQEAKAEYEKAFQAWTDNTDYRRLVEVKLNALGADPRQLDRALAAKAPALADAKSGATP
jgi:predicted negative regulator of RcsB-dependent stress response